MQSIKLSRIAEDIRAELAELFRSVKDPRVSPMLSIIKLDLSNDLSHCKVYVSALEGTEQTQRSVEGLKSAAGFLRRELSARLHLRKMPELHFIADDSIAYSANINRLLREQAETGGLAPSEETEDRPE